MNTKTLWRRLNDLEECERISRFSDLKNVDIQTETGSVKTTLYNLNVLNQLAMVEMYDDDDDTFLMEYRTE